VTSCRRNGARGARLLRGYANLRTPYFISCGIYYESTNVFYDTVRSVFYSTCTRTAVQLYTYGSSRSTNYEGMRFYLFRTVRAYSTCTRMTMLFLCSCE
jgi:hypothetical protein